MPTANLFVDVSLTSEDQNYTFCSLVDEQRQFPSFVAAAGDAELAQDLSELLSFETTPDQPQAGDFLPR